MSSFYVFLQCLRCIQHVLVCLFLDLLSSGGHFHLVLGGGVRQRLLLQRVELQLFHRLFQAVDNVRSLLVLFGRKRVRPSIAVSDPPGLGSRQILLDVDVLLRCNWSRVWVDNPLVFAACALFDRVFEVDVAREA